MVMEGLSGSCPGAGQSRRADIATGLTWGRRRPAMAKMGAAALFGNLAAMALRPAFGIVEKAPHGLDASDIQALALFGCGQHIPPCRKSVQTHADRGQARNTLREDAVMEHHHGVGNLAFGLADRLNEIELAAAVGSEVLHQQAAAARLHLALDLGVTAETFRLLADVEHRQ